MAIKLTQGQNVNLEIMYGVCGNLQRSIALGLNKIISDNQVIIKP
jgi:hypothetical protein